MGAPGTLMAAEMDEQPRVLASLATRRAEIADLVRGVLPADLAGILLVARGSSDNAAVFGRYAFELSSRRPVALAAPSLATLYGARTDLRRWLVVAVSQSGRTPEIVTVAESARASGGRVVAMTNDGASALARAADATVELGAGEEKAVPATKTFTAQLAAFAVIAEALGEVPWGDDDWAALPESVRDVLDSPAPVHRVTERLRDAEGLITVGRGFLFATALEASLKLKEAALINAQGYSAADLLHGPIAVVAPDLPVMAFVADGPARADMDELVATVRGRGADVVLVGPVDGDLPVRHGVAEALASIPQTVRAQQVAREVALLRGLDPDVPRGLSKVTMTR